jgi:hypothetical protein
LSFSASTGVEPHRCLLRVTHSHSPRHTPSTQPAKGTLITNPEQNIEVKDINPELNMEVKYCKDIDTGMLTAYFISKYKKYLGAFI